MVEGDAIHVYDIISDGNSPSDLEIWEELAFNLKERNFKNLCSGHCSPGYPPFEQLLASSVFRDCVTVNANKGFRGKFHHKKEHEDLPEPPTPTFDQIFQENFHASYWHKDHL